MLFCTFFLGFLLTLVNSKPIITCNDVLKVSVNQSYSQPIGITNVTYPYTLEVSGLPNGLKLQGTIIEGKVIQIGSYPVSIIVKDASQKDTTRNIYISCTPSPIPNQTLTNTLNISNLGVLPLLPQTYQLPRLNKPIIENSNNIFQDQSNTNNQISILLSYLQSNNLSLSTIDSDITVSQSVLEKQLLEQNHLEGILSSISSQNKTLTQNISYTQSNIQFLKNQMSFGDSTLNPLTKSITRISTKLSEQKQTLNEMKQKQQAANRTATQFLKQQKELSLIITQKNTIIQSGRQNITSIKQIIANSNTYTQKINTSLTLQNSIVADLQLKLQQAKKTLGELTKQFEYYSSISVVGPQMITANQSLVNSEIANINNNLNPLLKAINDEYQKQSTILNELNVEVSSLQVEISTTNINYQNVVGAKTTQERALNTTNIDVDALVSKSNYFKNQLYIVGERYQTALQSLSASKDKAKSTSEQLQMLKLKKKKVGQEMATQQAQIDSLKKEKQRIDGLIQKQILKQGIVSDISKKFAQPVQASVSQKWLGVDSSKLFQFTLTNLVSSPLNLGIIDSQVLPNQKATIISVTPKIIQSRLDGLKFKLAFTSSTISKSNIKNYQPKVGDIVGWSGSTEVGGVNDFITVNVNKILCLTQNFKM